jgi:hypothetical protein
MNDEDDDEDNSEIRWHPYLMLALGALFIVLGIANLFLTHEPDLWTPPPDWWAGAPTSPAPFSLLVGVLLLGAGAYTLNRNKR